MSAVAPLVRIRDLAYSYPGGPEILRIPALDVSGRALIAITGPSGAGKSTFAELLAGTLQSGYQGSVEVLGSEWRDLRRDADRQRHLRRIGFIPQDFGLLPDHTPRQMLQQDLTDSGVPPEEHVERIERALADVDITDLADQRIASLSGGQGQRVAIARMLARDVDLVIADEPTANLDPGLRGVVMGLLRKLSERVPVIVVTHDAAVAEACDRTIILQPAAPRFEGNLPVRGPRRRGSRIVLAVVALLLVLGGSGAAALLVNRRTPLTPALAEGTIRLRLVTISVSQSSAPKYQVTILYPQLVSSRHSAGLTRFDTLLSDAARKPIASFEDGLSTSALPTEFANETSMLVGTATTNLLDHQFASFSLNIWQFEAGAVHPFATVKTFNFDETTGRQIQVADLFQPGSDWLSVLSEESRVLLPRIIGPITLPGELDTGTTAVASNFGAWALTPWGLSIQFQEYQVADYASGQPTIVIPFGALRAIAAPDGPLASIEASRPLRSQLIPAVSAPVVDECSSKLYYSENGNAGPITCTDGDVNVPAWNFYASLEPKVMMLGVSASLTQVERAVCQGGQNMTFPERIYAYQLAARYYGWHFGTKPTQALAAC
jgi:ABC-type lipoprotein export system ATPase subunit